MDIVSDVAILGGGIAGLSLASFLDKSAVVLERDTVVGGLSRSYSLNGVAYDLGPHIIFSKNAQVLDLHTTLVETNRLRRSNQIVFGDRLIKYPFENDLSSLPPEQRDYCLREFLANPYEGYQPRNMMQFFLGLFGDGITQLYLAPYNHKIWKFDPSYLDLQMVERIPKPPREDVIASANGEVTEGYTHQLHFHYPKEGGFPSLIDAYRARAERNGQRTETGVEIRAIEGGEGDWKILTNQGTVCARQLVNCMPVHTLANYVSMPSDIRDALDRMLYNSIHIVVIQVARDRIGDHFALYIPDRDILFHRLSKLDFLGSAYQAADGCTTLMAEVTFRPGSYIASLSQDEIVKQVIDGLVKLDFIDHGDVRDVAVRTAPYAYVIYDLDHRRNTDTVLGWLRDQGISSVGRFAEFEYLNSDGVVERAMALASRMGENPG